MVDAPDSSDTSQTLSDTARERIAVMIYCGELPPGAAIDERGLATRFNVSRTPIREALHQLQALGLVQTVPRQGIYVTKISAKMLLHMLETMQELEVACVRFATRRISTASRAELAKTCDWTTRAAESSDPLEYEEANLAFHRIVYAAANNRYLTDQIEIIRQRTALFRRGLFEQPGRLEISAAEHRALSGAILAGDSPAAEQTMRKHIVVAGSGFAELIASIPENFLDS